MRDRSGLLWALPALVMVVLGVGLPAPGWADVTNMGPGQWSGGAGLGFMGNTPDGTEFALKGQAEYFFAPNLSVGPMVQYAGAGNDFLFGLTAMAKYYLSLANDNRAKLSLQAGLGFARAGIKDSEAPGIVDTYAGFLLPVGVGFEYAVTRQLALTADFLLNFTSLGDEYGPPGNRRSNTTNVMPALYVGVRF